MGSRVLARVRRGRLLEARRNAHIGSSAGWRRSRSTLRSIASRESPFGITRALMRPSGRGWDHAAGEEQVGAALAKGHDRQVHDVVGADRQLDLRGPGVAQARDPVRGSAQRRPRRRISVENVAAEGQASGLQPRFGPRAEVAEHGPTRFR